MPDAVERLEPCNLDAERAVLGSCLIDREVMATITSIVSPEDFYDLNYRDVFRTMVDMTARGKKVDQLTLCDELGNVGMLDKLGGQPFIVSLVDSVSTSANADYYARIVCEKALHRRLIDAGKSLVRMGYDESREMNELLEDAERMIFEISKSRNESHIIPLQDIIQPAIDKIGEAYNREDSRITGIATHFRGLDRLTSGLQRGALNIIAARPSMGKTALALNIARNVAVREKLPVLLFSLEMSAEQLVMRFLGSESRVNLQELINGAFAEGDWHSLTDAAGVLYDAPIFIDDSSILSTIEMKARARRFKALHEDLGLIVVDYLQLMSPARTTDNKANDVAEISRSLKAIARELDVPVIALSQLSRAVESRVDKKPQLADLRDSGAIEQDADLVGMLYRASYYASDDAGRNDSSASLNIAKNRNGPTQEIQLVFLREYTKFEDKAYQ